jgi:hypothetical protein
MLFGEVCKEKPGLTNFMIVQPNIIIEPEVDKLFLTYGSLSDSNEY